MAAQRTPPAGSSEYLNALLTQSDHTCPHDDKTKNRPLPKKLGFSRHQDGTITFLETDKVCQICYDRAVPDGFCVWSTDYKPSERPIAEEHRDRVAPRMMDSEEWSRYYGSKADLQPPNNESAALRLPMSDDYYPLMWEAGREDDWDYEPQQVRMPVNARDTFRRIQESGQPFYIDQLHLSRPWDPNAPDQHAEDRRVASENNVAYQEASRWHQGTGVGGAGANSIVEQRILIGRGVPMADGPNVEYQADGTGYLEDNSEEEAQRFPGQRVLQVPTNWPEGYQMPDEERNDNEERAMTGNVEGPNSEEIERRMYLEPNHLRLRDSSGDDNNSSGEDDGSAGSGNDSAAGDDDSAGGDGDSPVYGNDSPVYDNDSTEDDNNSLVYDNDSPVYEGIDRYAHEQDNDIEFENDSTSDDSD